MGYFYAVMGYFRGLGMYFLKGIKNGIIFTIFIDMAIYLFRSYKTFRK